MFGKKKKKKKNTENTENTEMYKLLIELLSKDKENERKKIHEKKKYYTKEIDSKSRYEVALRYGKYLKKIDEDIKVKGFRQLKSNHDITEINDVQEQEGLSSIYDNYEDDEMGDPILHETFEDDMKSMIDSIKTHKKNPSLDEVNELYENFAIIIKYLRNIASLRTTQKRVEKNNYIKQLNDEIIRVNLENTYNKVDADYYIRFLKTINDNFGGDLRKNTLLSLVGLIGESNKNEQIIELIQDLENNCDEITPEIICSIINTINEKVIINPENESELQYFESYTQNSNKVKNQEKRNAKLTRVRDIINSIDLKNANGEEIDTIISRIAELTPNRLQQYWKNYSNEMTPLNIANERLDNYLENKKRTLNLPKMNKNIRFNRKIVIGTAVGIGAITIGANALARNLDKKQNIVLEIPIAIEDTTFYAGDSIKIIEDHNEEDDIVAILQDKSKKVKVTKEDLSRSHYLKKLLNEMAIENEEER